MAFGKYTNDYNVRSKASSLSAVDEGLRKFMLRVTVICPLVWQ